MNIHRTSLYLLCAAVTTVGALPVAAQSASPITEAQRAYIAGDLATAKQKFQAILAQDPQNRVAANYLKMIATTEKQAGSGGTMSKQLEALIIPTLNFKEATFEAALDFLKERASALSGGKVQPSFVLDPEVNRLTPITLSLANVPFSAVLQYMGTLANVQFTVERYAITVRPKGAAAR